MVILLKDQDLVQHKSSELAGLAHRSYARNFATI
jgi:hypothetical protein